jgi:uncharacterized protein DUF6544
MEHAALDEPVRRYLAHATGGRADPGQRVRLQLDGRIKVGAWLRFASVWEGDGRSFSWRARAGPGPLRLLDVHDQFAEGRGSMHVAIRRLTLVDAHDEDTARSAAGRAALEAIWAPGALLPDRGVDWRAASDSEIVATWAVPPERPEVHLGIGREGEVRFVRAMRWRGRREGYAPFGVDVYEERSFDALTVPSRIGAGWGHGTAEWSPFFEASVRGLEVVPVPNERGHA